MVRLCKRWHGVGTYDMLCLETYYFKGGNVQEVRMIDLYSLTVF